MRRVEHHLRHLLDELSAAIGRSREDDRVELTRLRSGVESRLGEVDPEEHHSLIESLERAETQFEAEHPSLAQSIRQALISLSSAGI